MAIFPAEEVAAVRAQIVAMGRQMDDHAAANVLRDYLGLDTRVLRRPSRSRGYARAFSRAETQTSQNVRPSERSSVVCIT